MITEVHVDDLQIHAAPVPLANYAVSRLGGLGSPAPRRDLPTRARQHGAYGLTTYYDPRILPLEGKVSAATDAAFWPLVDALKQKLALVGSTHVLKFRRSGLAYLERATIIVDGELDLDYDKYNPYAEYAVQLAAPDPRLYGDTLNTISFASSGTAANAGNFNTPARITFHGAGTNPGLRNNALSTQNEIRLAYTMVGGDTIVVDTGDMTCTLNGADRPDLIDMNNPSYFWKLVAGSNSLTKLGGAVTIDVEWRDARI